MLEWLKTAYRYMLWTENRTPVYWTRALTCFKGNVEDQIQKRLFLLRFTKDLNLASGDQKKEKRVRLKKTSQINRMAKTWGIAGNRPALLINFYSDPLLLIPIHVVCVLLGKVGVKHLSSFFPYLVSPSTFHLFVFCFTQTATIFQILFILHLEE